MSTEKTPQWDASDPACHVYNYNDYISGYFSPDSDGRGTASVLIYNARIYLGYFGSYVPAYKAVESKIKEIVTFNP